MNNKETNQYSGERLNLPPIPGLPPFPSLPPAQALIPQKNEQTSKNFILVRSKEILSTKTKLLILDIDRLQVIETIEASTWPIIKGLTGKMQSNRDGSTLSIQGAYFLNPLKVTVSNQYAQTIAAIKRKGLCELQEFTIRNPLNEIIVDTKANNKGFLAMITGANLFVNILIANQPIGQLKEADLQKLRGVIGNAMDTTRWESSSKYGDGPYLLELNECLDSLTLRLLFCLMIVTPLGTK